MKTKTLNTGVKITYGNKGNMINVHSPYWHSKEVKVNYVALVTWTSIIIVSISLTLFIIKLIIK